MKAVRTTVEAFDQTVQKVLEEHSPVFVLFFGNELPETSESWCPDCVIADPRIRKAVLDHAPSTSALIEAPVGLRDEWRSSTNVYRSRYSLTAIPTLFQWTKVKCICPLLQEIHALFPAPKKRNKTKYCVSSFSLY